MASRVSLISPLSHDRRLSRLTRPSGTPTCPVVPGRRLSDAPHTPTPLSFSTTWCHRRCHQPLHARGDAGRRRVPGLSRGGLANRKACFHPARGCKKHNAYRYAYSLSLSFSASLLYTHTCTHSDTYSLTCFIRWCMLIFMKLNHNKLKELQIFRKKEEERRKKNGSLRNRK